MTVAQITARKDTSANWAAANPILAAGELGFDTTVKRLKMGDGLTSWGALGWATMATDEVAAVLAASESINAGIDTTDGAFAAVLANPASASSTELSAAIVESGNVPVDYTWDAGTGFIATITEHYPAPIGNRVTTYSSYGTYGPTHEVDPDGGAWTLTYDSNGNPTGRVEA